MRQKQGRSVGGDGGDKVSKDSFERRGCPPLPADTSTLPRGYPLDTSDPKKRTHVRSLGVIIDSLMFTTKITIRYSILSIDLLLMDLSFSPETVGLLSLKRSGRVCLSCKMNITTPGEIFSWTCP